MVDPKPTALAKFTPKRADSRVDPTDYTPAPKAAPEPAIESGIREASKPVETKPVEPAVISGEAVEVAPSFSPPKRPSPSIVERVKKLVEPGVSKGEPVKRLSTDARRKAIADEDARRMRAVRRYAKSLRSDIVGPAIHGLLLAKGLKPVETGDGEFEKLYTHALTVKVTSGRRVMKSGEERYRELDISSHIAYTLGRGSLSIEEWVSEQWLRHPLISDILLTLTGIGTVVASLYFDEIVKKFLGEFLGHIFNRAVPSSEEPIKAEATIHDARNIAEGM
jgi:hypothetical protein